MKTYGTFLTLLLSFCSFQKMVAQVSIYGGPQLTSADYSIRNVQQATERKPGFMAGLSLDIPVEGPVHFSPSLYFSRKGYNVTFTQQGNPPDSSALNNNTTLNTLSLVPLLQFNFSKSKSHLFARFGPGFNVALTGQETFETTANRRVDRAMPFAYDGYSFATLFGAIQVGYQHKSGLLFFAHYEHGLSNLNNKDKGPVILHRVAGVSAGWRLGKAR